MGAIHFGWFGGGVVKIVYFLLGLGLTYLAASGMHIWLVRRRDKGRPAPVLERLWSATLWGQPAGIALAAVAALLAGDVAAAISVWLAVSVLFWMAAIRASAEAIARTSRRLLAVALFAAAAAQPVVHGGGDPVAWIVDIVLAATGIIMLLPDLRTMRTSATSAICDSGVRS